MTTRPVYHAPENSLEEQNWRWGHRVLAPWQPRHLQVSAHLCIPHRGGSNIGNVCASPHENPPYVITLRMAMLSDPQAAVVVGTQRPVLLRPQLGIYHDEGNHSFTSTIFLGDSFGEESRNRCQN